MKMLNLLVVSLSLSVIPACITVQEASKETCESCAGANTDDGKPDGGTSSGTSTDLGGADSTSAGAPDLASAGQAGAPPQLPATVSIEVLSALIGPGKVDGTTWDGTGTVPPDILEALADAFGYPGVDKIVDVVQQAAYQALSKPDPFGTANLNPDGSGFDAINDVELATRITNTEDTFTPIWPMPFPGWKDLAFDDALQVRLTLYDEDLSLDDDMGVVTINYADLLEAWQAQDSHWIRVEDQGDGQILAIQVQVSGAVQ
jgi:hypothetical protein